MKFKIHTKEVRRASRKNKLKICNRQFYKMEYNETLGHYATGSACAISQLFSAKTGKIDDEDAAERWAFKTFGKAYTSGFIHGFDGSEKHEDYLNHLNKKYYQDYYDGFRNGELLRKTLIEA